MRVSCILNNMHLSANLVMWHCFKEEREDESFIDMKQVTPFPMSMKSGETRTEALQLYLPPFFSRPACACTAPCDLPFSPAISPRLRLRTGGTTRSRRFYGGAAEATSARCGSAGRAKVCGSSHYNRTAAYSPAPVSCMWRQLLESPIPQATHSKIRSKYRLVSFSDACVILRN